jgi:hypothetical protein
VFRFLSQVTQGDKVEAKILEHGGMLVETQADLKKAYEATLSISWAMIAALVLCPIVVEIVRMRLGSFGGISPKLAHQVRDFAYGLAIILPLCMRSMREAIFKRSKLSDVKTLVYKLQTVTAITMLVAETPAILGFLLFLLGGFYREFYIALAYSLLVIFVYFPRRHAWERLLRSGVFY